MQAQEIPAHNLSKWVQPDETAVEFFKRHGREAVITGLPFVDAHIKLRPGHVLELSGPNGSAKTELLIQIAVNLLCSSHASEEQEHVVVVDCDGKFDVLRLLQVLTARLTMPGRPPQLNLEGLLKRFHLVRCFSSLELLLALAALPDQLTALQGRCRLLMLDNIAATIWHDRAAVFSRTNQQLPQLQQQWPGQQLPPPQQQQQMGLQGPSGVMAANASPDAPSPGLDALRMQQALAALLQGMSQHLRFPVIVTKLTSVSQLEKDGHVRLIQKEVLTPPLQGAVTHRVLLMPVSPGGRALSAAAGPDQQGAQVLLQWQAADFAGPLQRCTVEHAGVHVVSH